MTSCNVYTYLKHNRFPCRYYRIYCIGLNTVFASIIPLLSLVYLNICTVTGTMNDGKILITNSTSRQRQKKNAWILVHVASQDLSLSPLTLVWERKRKLFSKIFFLLLSVERGDRRERFFSASEASVILLSSAEGIWKPTGHITHGYVALSAREKCLIFLIRKSMYRWQGFQNLILKTFNFPVII